MLQDKVKTHSIIILLTAAAAKPTCIKSWRDGLVVRKEHLLTALGQDPHDGLEPPVTTVPGDLVPSSGLCGYRMHMVH